MAENEAPLKTPFLKRWSQRKLAASRESEAPSAAAAPNVATPPTVAEPAAPASAATSAAAGLDTVAPQLPPVESLSFDSDFTAFLQPEVDESVKRQALRRLFADPRFNVMDGLDVYIDDYGKSAPIPPELVARLNQAKFLFDPPKTRVNEHGHVEDVPEAPAEAAPDRVEDTAVDSAPEPAQAAIVDNATNSPPIETTGSSAKLPLPPEQTR